MFQNVFELFRKGQLFISNKDKKVSMEQSYYHQVIKEASYFDRIHMTKNGLEYDQIIFTPLNVTLEHDRKMTLMNITHWT